jgi:hypothetical protein
MTQTFEREFIAESEDGEKKKKRVTWLDKVTLCSKQYTLPYCDLTICKRRIDEVGYQVIAACLDQNVCLLITMMACVYYPIWPFFEYKRNSEVAQMTNYFQQTISST